MALDAHAAVLIVDDDPGILETTSLILSRLGIRVHEAPTGAAAMGIARAERVELVLVDYRLPDMTGFDIVRALRGEGITIPWIAISAFMDYDVALEAGKLGALRAVSPPYDVEHVVLGALSQIDERQGARWPRRPVKPSLRHARSAVERCAWLIWVACDADEDPSTLQEWASAVAIGYSSLREACQIARVNAHEARNFARFLRVLVHTEGRIDALEAHLKFCDRRTLDTLTRRAGLIEFHSSAVTLDEYLAAQRFIPPDHPVIIAIKELVTLL